MPAAQLLLCCVDAAWIWTYSIHNIIERVESNDRGVRPTCSRTMTCPFTHCLSGTLHRLHTGGLVCVVCFSSFDFNFTPLCFYFCFFVFVLHLFAPSSSFCAPVVFLLCRCLILLFGAGCFKVLVEVGKKGRFCPLQSSESPAPGWNLVGLLSSFVFWQVGGAALCRGAQPGPAAR